MSDAERNLLLLAEQQYGVVSLRDARAAGMSVAEWERRIRQERFRRLFPGVYRAAGVPPSARQRAFAAWRWLGPDATVSRMTAAALLRLDGCRSTDLDVSVSRTVRRRTGTGGVRIHRVSPLAATDRAEVDRIPCTSATRTIIDCAALLDDEALEVAFESARRMGLTSFPALERRAAELGAMGRPGTRAVRRLLAHQRAGQRPAEYQLEVKTARLLRSSALPRPVRQHAVGNFRIDFAYPDARVGIECEGFEYHGNRLAWKRDKRRSAQLEAHGWRLVVVTWDDVTRRANETIDRIAIALGEAVAA